MTDYAFEQDLRAAFREAVDPRAPASLRASVMAIPDAVAATTERRTSSNRKLPLRDRMVPIGLAAAAVVVTVVIGLSLIGQPGQELGDPSPVPHPTPVAPTPEDADDPPDGPASIATLRTRTAATSVEYRIPADLQLRFEQDESHKVALVAPEEDRGIVIADVTVFTLHDGHDGDRGSAHSGEEFFEVLDRSNLFEVVDRAPTELQNFVAMQATVEAEPGRGAHIDLAGSVVTVDFRNPNRALVTQVNGRAVLIQVWAESEELLAAWWPDALRIIETFELSPVAD